MKKRTIGKRVAIVALSSVLAVGALSALAGCGNNSATTMSVTIFCNKSDEQTNKAIMNNWAKRYAEENNLGFDIKIDAIVKYDKGDYFTELNKAAGDGINAFSDVMYLSPRLVKKFSKLGYVMDLSPYLADSSIASLEKVWNNAVSYYGYDGTSDYEMGQPIEYSAAKSAFVTSADTSKEVKLYGLPKDYSNFSMGYNKHFFSAELVSDYQTRKASETRKVVNPSASNEGIDKSLSSGNKIAKTYTGGEAIATFAASGKYNIYDENGKVVGEATATAGQEAPMLAIGVPVTYRPFNYYLFNTYSAALDAGDPVACLVEGLTAGEGFTVTIPGLPGWTFNIEDAKGYTKDSAAYNAAVNKNAEYDATIGHTVLTYQEYGALTWAMTYYLNTFAWENRTNVLEGNGGRLIDEGNKKVQYAVYGGEQYEGAQGGALYLLPWLAASDGDFLDVTSTKVLNATGIQKESDLSGDANKNKKATEYAGKSTEKRTKVNLDGTQREVDVQYGLNSETFLKVYSAFGNHGAIWNANAGSAKDGHSDDKLTGWDYYRRGRSVFYGAGSWDAATRNDSDPATFNFGQMAAPVAEEYALYSTISTPDYEGGVLVEKSNANNAKQTGNSAVNDNAQRQNAQEGLKVYDQDEIYANLILRQDKWVARMDSVGYAANGRLAKLSADSKEGWKAKAAASLIEELTVRENEQVTLTYAGAQLPNFRVQCTDFLKYQDKTYSNYENGAFKDMLTPEGFADNTEYGGDEKGRDIWDYYYTVVKAMAADSLSGNRRSWTVKQWIDEAGYGDYDGSEHGSASKKLRYDTQYDNMLLSEFTGESGNNYYAAMKILRMVNFTYADRDLNIRMQTGLNAMRDSTMYTPDDTWLGELDAAGATPKTYMLSYSVLMTAGDLTNALQNVREQAIGRTYEKANQNNKDHAKWWTPAYFATYFSLKANQKLTSLIETEATLLGNK